jgi:hypothetical protein
VPAGPRALFEKFPHWDVFIEDKDEPVKSGPDRE